MPTPPRPPRARACVRHALAVSIALVAACAPFADVHAVVATHGQVRILVMRARSIHDAHRSVRVYLPPSYDAPGAARRRYPTVYLLHGWPGGDGNWPGSGRAPETLDSLSARGEIPEMIAVMPNGRGLGLLGRSLYLNAYDGADRMEDFVAHDLVAWADSAFRTLRDPAHRAILGLSEGASGALNVAFRHPDVFGACAGLSGQYVLANDLGMRRVFGPEPGATRLREANSPALYAGTIVPQLRHQTIYFAVGRGDGELEDNRAFHDRLTTLGVPHVYQEFPGSHGWTFWRTHLRDALLACAARMR